MGNAPASLCSTTDEDHERRRTTSFLSHSAPTSSEDVATDVLTCTAEHMLDSQGLQVANDGTAAFAHFSTVCPEYYMSRYASPTGINMDRGGFGQSAVSGRNYAAIFDGVSAGGAVNAYAAQHFTQTILEFLATNEAALRENTPAEIGESLFYQASASKPHLRHSADGGSATGAFVWFVPSRDPLVTLSGAAIGDSAVITVDLLAESAVQLNGVDRISDFGSADSGGQIAMGMGVVGKVSSFSVSVDAQNTLVLLATDGLTDNLATLGIVPLIISSPFFDESRVPGWSRSTLPSEDDLRGVVECEAAPARQVLREVRCRDAVLRLSNYVEWVTYQRAMQELQYYQIELQYHELIRKSNRGDEGTMHGVSNLSQSEPDADLESLEEEMKRLQKLKAGRPIGGKTDDAMLVVITPYNATHPVMREHSRVSRAAQRERAPASMVRRTRNTRL